MNKREKVQELFEALTKALDARGIKPADQAEILETVFCRCKCGTPLFVRRVTEFPEGYTTVYCPDCLSETIIEAGLNNEPAKKLFIQVVDKDGVITETDDLYYFEENGIRYLDGNFEGQDFFGNKVFVHFFIKNKLTI